MHHLSLSRRALVSLAAGLGLAGRAHAADYPTRPLRIIVPYTPGGTTDIAARLIAEPLAKLLAQPVIVENRPGANSIVGAAAAATSPADGYTLVMVLPAHAANATLQAGKLPFDPIASFAPVSLVVSAPLVLAGSRQIPAQTLRDYLDYARKNPGRMNYGSSGIGATAHLAMELLKLRTSVQMEHIPYRGTQPALQDLMAGNIGLLFDTYSTLKPQFEAGNIRPLGIAAAGTCRLRPRPADHHRRWPAGFRRQLLVHAAGPGRHPARHRRPPLGRGRPHRPRARHDHQAAGSRLRPRRPHAGRHRRLPASRDRALGRGHPRRQGHRRIT